ncbi:hypothetical protein ACEZCY_14665 [Streptacidiphilus sp. N1-12]|uniref:Uncharacterized protein n=2 Tax=Streptacidiphilus alkalitolerans TaxID=3342712 RepID=A0ABV6WEK7_9ACTN
MATMDPIEFRCPNCAQILDLPVTATPGPTEGITVTVQVKVDPETLLHHMTSHLKRP